MNQILKSVIKQDEFSQDKTGKIVVGIIMKSIDLTFN